MKSVLWGLAIILCVLNAMSFYWLQKNRQLSQQLALQQAEINQYTKGAGTALFATSSDCVATLNKGIDSSAPLHGTQYEPPDFSQQLKAGLLVKYALIFDSLNLGRLERESLEGLMLSREQILNRPLNGYFVDEVDTEVLINEQQQAVAAIDAQIEELLGDENGQRYKLLKNSDLEQFQLRQFESALPKGQQLSSDQHMQVLLAKLRHKKNFDGMMENILVVPMDQAVLVAELFKGLEAYRRDYFGEVDALLPETTAKALKGFEGTAFEELKYSLQQQLAH